MATQNVNSTEQRSAETAQALCNCAVCGEYTNKCELNLTKLMTVSKLQTHILNLL